LQARSREIWVDLEDIIPSARWRDEIRDAITEADAVVFVITPDSITSEVCRTEVEYATEQAKRLVPILVRPTPSEGVPPSLAELNWLSFLDDTNFEAGINRLVEVLDTDSDRVHPSLATTLTGINASCCRSSAAGGLICCPTRCPKQLVDSVRPPPRTERLAPGCRPRTTADRWSLGWIVEPARNRPGCSGRVGSCGWARECESVSANWVLAGPDFARGLAPIAVGVCRQGFVR
jgi:hypothetical protein